MNNSHQNKILIILMQELSEVIAEGVPAVRYIQSRYPDSELHFLTYDQGEEIIRLAHPEVVVNSLKKGQWPDNILQAMETFLGLAEDIIGQGYSKIINLDTWFMPCFLARFLKDAGEPLDGNLLSISVQELIDQIQSQTLQTEYVHDASRYMSSTWFSMARWHTPWWEGAFTPDNGYPEFYLRSCCGFEELSMDMLIDVPIDPKMLLQQKIQNVIALALTSQIQPRHYPYSIELKSLLKKKGFFVWDLQDKSLPLRQKLAQLGGTDLLVSIPGEELWMANATGCKTLMVSQDIHPTIYMPDFATDPGLEPVPAQELAESIVSVFEEQEND